MQRSPLFSLLHVVPCHAQSTSLECGMLSLGPLDTTVTNGPQGACATAEFRICEPIGPRQRPSTHRFRPLRGRSATDRVEKATYQNCCSPVHAASPRRRHMYCDFAVRCALPSDRGAVRYCASSVGLVRVHRIHRVDTPNTEKAHHRRPEFGFRIQPHQLLAVSFARVLEPSSLTPL